VRLSLLRQKVAGVPLIMPHRVYDVMCRSRFDADQYFWQTHLCGLIDVVVYAVSCRRFLDISSATVLWEVYDTADSRE